MSLTNEERYDILTTPQNIHSGNIFDVTELYGSVKNIYDGIFNWESTYTYVESTNNNFFQIHYTVMGDNKKCPPVLFLHGVPTNKDQYIEVQRYLSRFFTTVSIDMLGMGKSSKPLEYVSNTGENAWLWKYDCDYIYELMNELFPGEKFIFVADDWGGGIALTYACHDVYHNTLEHLFLLDPISFDGYPVNEIQAIGRLSKVEDEDTFRMLVGAFDQTVVQILKTMVYDSSKFDQFNLRRIMSPYVNSNYTTEPRLDSKTMNLDYHAIRVLADRASILSPSLLLPLTDENPNGINYDHMITPMTIIWGENDNMMPAIQAQEFIQVFDNVNVFVYYVQHAGHFVAVDQPERVSTIIINQIQSLFGPKRLKVPFFGLYGIAKGSEKEMINKLSPLF